VSWSRSRPTSTRTAPGLGVQAGLASANVLYETWKDHSDYARERVPNAVVTITMHPQCIGRAHHMLMLERLLAHMTSFDDVWFATLSEVSDAFGSQVGALG
jgi:hypothetical protein